MKTETCVSAGKLLGMFGWLDSHWFGICHKKMWASLELFRFWDSPYEKVYENPPRTMMRGECCSPDGGWQATAEYDDGADTISIYGGPGGDTVAGGFRRQRRVSTNSIWEMQDASNEVLLLTAPV